jgi:flagellar hook-associated protein 3 FlgL
MSFRVTENSSRSAYITQVNNSRQRLAAAQERIATGKRINRPSDDPLGAEDVIRLRADQRAIEQFQKNADFGKDKLLAGDVAINNYHTLLDRARVLVSQATSDSTPAASKAAIATEIDGIRDRIYAVANTRNGDEYLFGGTRQSAPPFAPSVADPNVIEISAIPAVQSTIQIEPGGVPVKTGVTAETLFTDATGNIFDTLSSISTALRGTGDEVADRNTALTNLDRLVNFSNQANVAQTQIGASINNIDSVDQRLTHDHLSYEENIQRIEAADFTEAAVDMVEAERLLEAIIQSGAHRGRRSLIDFLG